MQAAVFTAQSPCGREVRRSTKGSKLLEVMWLSFSISQRSKGKMGPEEGEWLRKTSESNRLKEILKSREIPCILLGWGWGGPKLGQLLECSQWVEALENQEFQTCPGAAEGHQVAVTIGAGTM